MTYTFSDVTEEKKTVKAILDAPMVILDSDHFDVFVPVCEPERIKVIDWLNEHKIDHMSTPGYVTVIDKPGRLYKIMVGLLREFSFFVAM